jgi:Na+-transporting NADH:ubiquinone oxidoreductase subunit NqrF
VVLEQYLSRHENLRAVEYYLCGPPQMVRACIAMLEGLNVDAGHIAFDEF